MSSVEEKEGVIKSQLDGLEAIVFLPQQGLTEDNT